MASATAAPLRFRSAVMALPPWSPAVRAPVGGMLPRPAGIRTSAGGDQEEPREGQEQGAVLEGSDRPRRRRRGSGRGRPRPRPAPAGRGTGAGRCCAASRPRRRGRRAGGGRWCARRRRCARGASAGGSTSRRRGGRRGRPRRRRACRASGVGGGLAHQPVGRLVEVVGHLHREAAARREPGHQRREEGLVVGQPLQQALARMTSNGPGSAQAAMSASLEADAGQPARGRPPACRASCRCRGCRRRGSARRGVRWSCPDRSRDRRCAPRRGSGCGRRGRGRAGCARPRTGCSGRRTSPCRSRPLPGLRPRALSGLAALGAAAWPAARSGSRPRGGLGLHLLGLLHFLVAAFLALGHGGSSRLGSASRGRARGSL